MDRNDQGSGCLGE